MANHNLPTLTSTYSNFVQEMDARMDDISIGFDPAFTTVTNQATNTIRWSSASNKWQKWSGTTWNDLAATYAISISGSAGTANTLSTARAINGVDFNGSAPISINLNNLLTINSSGTGAASGATFNGGGAVTISYNTVGAPSTSGVGATGTWAISISGNAASATTATNAGSVTNGVYTVGDQSITGTKTFTGVVGVKTVSDTVFAMGASNAIDPANGGIQTKTIAANTTFTESLATGQTVLLTLTNASLFTISWPTVKWVRAVGNIAPSLTTLDTIILWKIGTTLYASYVGSGV